ncbi:MAG: hypothetical protein ABSH06_03130 [Thermodesulfobacteriota bacterium]
MTLNVDNLTVEFGLKLIDQIQRQDGKIKELGDALEMQNAYTDGGFPTTYEGLLNAVISGQETEISRLEGLLVAVRTVNLG